MTADPLDQHQSLYQEIRRALRHLYDPVYLQRSPLHAPVARRRGEPASGQEVKALRQVLLELVDDLAPSDNVPLRSERRRPHVALRGHYVEQREVAEVAEELAISERHLRRELRAGVEAMARAFARRFGPLDAQGAGGGEDEETDESLGGFRRRWATLDLVVEVRGVLQLLSGLAGERGIRLRDPEVSDPVLVASNRIVLRQALLSLYTHLLECVETAGGQAVQTRLLLDDDNRATIALSGACVDPKLASRPTEWVDQNLLSLLDASLIWAPAPEGAMNVSLRLPSMPMHTVLVIDDTQSLHQLFQRFLVGQPLFLRSAYDVDSGLALAQEHPPDLIILDIMMPERDGWEALCALRELDETQDVPVVICSVLRQEALARSLSATGYLTKPVTQEALLAELTRLGLLETA